MEGLPREAINQFVFTDLATDNWFHKKYYYGGSNSRYWTFQLALNILLQTRKNPVIVETGCQRMKDDLGAGMSTSIFGEFIQRYGGMLYTVDLIDKHLNICKECTQEYANNTRYILGDSVAFLSGAQNLRADLLYLDSYDYPIGDTEWDMKERVASQEHCIKEFIAAQNSGVLQPSTLLLIDDNQLPGGGKPRLLKEHLGQHGWVCMLDVQQSLWICPSKKV